MTASNAQIQYLTDLRAELQVAAQGWYLNVDNIRVSYPEAGAKVAKRIRSLARSGAYCANHPDDAAGEIADFLADRPWLRIAPGQSREQITEQITAVRDRIANLTDEEIAALDPRTISAYIDAAKELVGRR